MNEPKSKGMQKITLVVLVLFFLAIQFQPVNAGLFNVGANVCQVNWFCGPFDNGDCGTRSCYDANSCGNNFNRPIETIACSVVVASGGGGSSGGETVTVDAEIKEFTLSSDLFKIYMEEDSKTSKTLKITSLFDSNYSLEVSDSILSLSDKTFSLGEGEQKVVTLNFDSNGISAGIYVISIPVTSSVQTKNVAAIVVVEKKEVPFGITVDLKNENNIVRNESIVKPEIRIAGDSKGLANISYAVLDSYGNYISSNVKEVNLDESKIFSFDVEIPQNVADGYYIFSANISKENNTAVAYDVFVSAKEGDFVDEFQTPAELKLPIDALTILYLVIGIVFISGIGFLVFKGTKGELSVNPKIWKSKYFGKNKKEGIDKKLRNLYEVGLISEHEFKDFLKKAGISSVKTHKKIVKEKITPVVIVPQKVIEEKKPIIKVPKKKKVAKKKPKKVVVKKEPVKVVPKVKLQEIHLRKCSDDQAFFLKNSQRLHSIIEFKKSLKGMPDDVFYHHVTPDRNDFSNWIRGVFKEEELADALRICKTKEEFYKALSKFDIKEWTS